MGHNAVGDPTMQSRHFDMDHAARMASMWGSALTPELAAALGVPQGTKTADQMYNEWYMQQRMAGGGGSGGIGSGGGNDPNELIDRFYSGDHSDEVMRALMAHGITRADLEQNGYQGAFFGQPLYGDPWGQNAHSAGYNIWDFPNAAGHGNIRSPGRALGPEFERLPDNSLFGSQRNNPLAPPPQMPNYRSDLVGAAAPQQIGLAPPGAGQTPQQIGLAPGGSGSQIFIPDYGNVTDAELRGLLASGKVRAVTDQATGRLTYRLQ